MQGPSKQGPSKATIDCFSSFVRRYGGASSKRLSYRTMRSCDSDALYAAVSDPCVHTWVGSFPQPFTRIGFDAWLCERLAWMQEGRCLPLAVMRGESDECVGFISATLSRSDDGAVIACALHPSAWGQGLASEMAQSIIQRLLSSGVPALFVTCAMDNIPSAKLILGLGFAEMPAVLLETASGPRPSRSFVLRAPARAAFCALGNNFVPNGRDSLGGAGAAV